MQRWLNIAMVMTALALNGPVSLGAAAPPVVSQLIYVSQPVLDEYGVKLAGTDPGAGYFGLDAVEGVLVHVYQATDGVIYPPDVDGLPDSRNVLLLETRIGAGASAKLANPGTFSAYLSPRPSAGVKLFVRVFNHASAAGTSFYRDSQLFTVSWTTDTKFLASFSGDMNPLDSNDNDGDGINNSWEKSAGTNPDAADSDNDGLSDQEEMVAGSLPTDESSAFLIADMIPEPPDRMRLVWQTESGRFYTVETMDLSQPAEGFTGVHEVYGNGAEYELSVPASSEGMAMYRIKVERLPDAE